MYRFFFRLLWGILSPPTKNICNIELMKHVLPIFCSPIGLCVGRWMVVTVAGWMASSALDRESADATRPSWWVAPPVNDRSTIPPSTLVRMTMIDDA